MSFANDHLLVQSSMEFFQFPITNIYFCNWRQITYYESFDIFRPFMFWIYCSTILAHQWGFPQLVNNTLHLLWWCLIIIMFLIQQLGNFFILQPNNQKQQKTKHLKKILLFIPISFPDLNSWRCLQSFVRVLFLHYQTHADVLDESQFFHFFQLRKIFVVLMNAMRVFWFHLRTSHEFLQHHIQLAFAPSKRALHYWHLLKRTLLKHR